MRSDITYITGLVCVSFWVVAYAGIIYRGAQEKTFGMPVAALAANLSWEAAYSFFIDPFADEIHLLSIVWFVIDLVILWQVWRFGPREFEDKLSRRGFNMMLLGGVAIAFPVVYLGFSEFHDPDGEYTGFGVNFMMSILFVAMLLERESPRGQSMYIAVSKFFGTFFAWLATAFTVTTNKAEPWPDSFGSFVIDSVTHDTYPLTRLINVLYLVTFLVDIGYIVTLRRHLIAAKMSPWRHF